MINVFFSLLILSFLLPNKINYWNLGVSIQQDAPKKRIIKKEIPLNNITIEQNNFRKNSNELAIYTLNENYVIQPEKKETQFSLDSNNVNTNYNDLNIKSLMANEEYFEAAKRMILLDTEDISSIFINDDDYYYCASFIYYNLGNTQEAHFNLSNILSKDSDPKILFLEAMILKDQNPKQSDEILNNIIINFPADDYANYAKNILRDGQND